MRRTGRLQLIADIWVCRLFEFGATHYKTLVRPILFRFPPEAAGKITFWSLEVWNRSLQRLEDLIEEAVARDETKVPDDGLC